MNHPAVVVISPQFCAGYPVNLTIESGGNIRVTDANGNIMFRVREKGNFFSVHDRRVMLDAAGTPVITLQKKIRTVRHRWNVFRGDSTDARDMLFSVRKSSLLPTETKLHVFLASNTREDVCDFEIKGSWSNDSGVVYTGNSNNIIARMHRTHTAQSILLGRNSFALTVYPHVDYAFIVSVVVILEEIYEHRKNLLEEISDVISSD